MITRSHRDFLIQRDSERTRTKVRIPWGILGFSERTLFSTPEKESSTLPKCTEKHCQKEKANGKILHIDRHRRHVNAVFKIGNPLFYSTLSSELNSDALKRPTELISKRGKRRASYRTRVLKKSESDFSEQDSFLTNVSKPNNSFGDINSASIFL